METRYIVSWTNEAGPQQIRYVFKSAAMASATDLIRCGRTPTVTWLANGKEWPVEIPHVA